jgi:chromosome segregation ATPase
VCELRHLKSEAREAGKLLEDKKALEAKLREVQGTLELVQGQRNELRQEVKDLKATLAQASDAQQVREMCVVLACADAKMVWLTRIDCYYLCWLVLS